ncbi:MAG: SDR family NAD(P)-dependent oxidoreductase [Acidimicrobiales bacterium]
MNDVTAMPQSAVVIGATSDLARAVVRRLAHERLDRLVIAGRDDSALAELRDELSHLGLGQVEPVHLDVRESALHDRLAGEAKETLGEIDLVLVAAGALGTGDLDELDGASTAELIETNFAGPAGMLTAFAKIMAAQGHGHIVVFSSAAIMRVRRANFVYGSAKVGLDGFCQGLSDVLSQSGVHVMIVRPGFVPTKMTAGLDAAPFSTETETVADAVVRGLARRDSVVWVPAGLKLLSFVVRMVPRRLWRMVRT